MIKKVEYNEIKGKTYKQTFLGKQLMRSEIVKKEDIPKKVDKGGEKK